MKRTLAVFLVFALVLAAAGCAARGLSEKYTEEKVTARAKEAVQAANAYDFQALEDMSSPELKAVLTAQTLEEAMKPTLDQAGEFKEFSASACVGAGDPEAGADYATCVLSCKYENRTITYTISMDESYELVGFYFK